MNAARSVDGSKARDRPSTASTADTASCTGPTSVSANGVGVSCRPWRTSNGSSKCLRSRAKDALIAGWPTDIRSAARVTLRSVSRASNATSRLRSTPASPMALPLRPSPSPMTGIRGISSGDDATSLIDPTDVQLSPMVARDGT